jgi:hypothetical protein
MLVVTHNGLSECTWSPLTTGSGAKAILGANCMHGIHVAVFCVDFKPCVELEPLWPLGRVWGLRIPSVGGVCVGTCIFVDAHVAPPGE